LTDVFVFCGRVDAFEDVNVLGDGVAPFTDVFVFCGGIDVFEDVYVLEGGVDALFT
jgi:hypothetical protein